jgi:hypothetical protein
MHTPGNLMIVKEKPAIRCFSSTIGFSSALTAGRAHAARTKDGARWSEPTRYSCPSA